MHSHVKSKQKKSDTPAVTNGGRALNAIYENDSLNGHETAVLVFLGSRMDFKSSFVGVRWWVSANTIAKNIKFSSRTVQRCIASLVERGYIGLEHRRRNDGGKDCNQYYLTSKIFDEYEAKNKSPKPRRMRLPDGNPVPLPDATPIRQPVACKSHIENSPNLNPQHNARGRAYDRTTEPDTPKDDAGDSDGPVRGKPVGEEKAAWEKLDQSPCKEIGMAPMDWLGLMSLRKAGMKPHEVEDGVAWFVDSHIQRPYQDIKNPTGFMLAKIVSRWSTGAWDKANVKFSNQQRKEFCQS